MNPLFRNAVPWLLLVLSSAPAFGADDADWYQVEIIVFEQLGAGTESEALSGSLAIPDPAGARELESAGGGAFARLGEDQLQLGGIVQALRASGDRRPILHWGWRQPVRARTEAQPVRIHGGRQYTLPAAVPASEPGVTGEPGGLEPPRPAPPAAPTPQPATGPEFQPTLRTIDAVDGTLLIARGRYLHVWTDLVFTAPAAELAGAAPPGTDPNAVVQFRMQNHRRMRSGELHYLDHPAFGLIVLFTPVETPAAEATPEAAPAAAALP